MSIAVIVDTFPRWSERFIARELNELRRRGLNFSIYCLRAGDSACDRDPEFADLIPLRVVLPACFIPSVARELGVDAEALERRKLVEAELGLTAFRQIGCANSFVKLLREHKHTLVYAHFASLPSTLAWLAASALNLPLVISAHARDVFVDGQIISEKLRYARRMFTCNARALSVLREAELKATVEGRAVLMRHGLPLERYPFKKREAFDQFAQSGKLALVTIGRLVQKKGIDVLLSALASPGLKNLNWNLTLLGEGPERKTLTRQIEGAGFHDRVVFHGAVDEAEVRRRLETADIFAVPSRNSQDGDSDGVPNAMLEAFALGVPVLGTDAGSLGDALTDSTGTVAAADDAAALAAALQKMLNEPQATFARTIAARHFIETHYDIRKNTEPLINELTAV